MLLEPPNRRKQQNGPQAIDECWECGKKGHWANECRSKRMRAPREYRRRYHSPYSRNYDRRSNENEVTRESYNEDKFGWDRERAFNERDRDRERYRSRSPPRRAARPR